MAGRYLIINADDFGMCRETNAAIVKLLREGRLTSTTLMAPCPEAEEAAQLAQDNGFSVGMHITLTSDFPTMPWSSTAPADQVRSLLDSEGHFYHAPQDLYQHADDGEVEVEIRAQFAFLTQRGVTVDHVDSHVGTVYGLGGRSFLPQVFRLCAEHRLPFRLPKSENYLKAVFQGAVPESIAKLHRQAVAAAEVIGVPLLTSMFTSPHRASELGGYEPLKEFYLRNIREIGEGITEIFLHPSYQNEAIAAVFPEWQKRIWEFEFLLDDDLPKVLEEEGIGLVSWSSAPWDQF
jgi:predicted glycoside hydrolase/deacetylase ChbG (UPF0249 family)